MANKVERFTQRARRVLALAQEAAEQMKHSTIGSEHILLGLAREEGSAAGRVLCEMGLTAQQVEAAILPLPHDGIPAPDDRPSLTSDAKRLLELTVDEARRLDHHFIGTEHLLLGMLRLRDGHALDVLKQLNVNQNELRTRTLVFLRNYQESKLSAEVRFLDWLLDKILAAIKRNKPRATPQEDPPSTGEPLGDTPQK